MTNPPGREQPSAAPFVVIDTNVLSYIFKGDTRGPAYARLIAPYRGLISFQTLAELNKWALKHRWGARRTQQLFDFLSPFGIIHSSASLAARWAAVRVGALRAGRPIDPADAWIAATALAVGCPLVTHNAADFAGVPGLSVLTGAEG